MKVDADKVVLNHHLGEASSEILDLGMEASEVFIKEEMREIENKWGRGEHL